MCQKVCQFMFEISRNEFISTGKIWYLDPYGNKLFVARKEDEIVFKLRFIADGIRCVPLKVPWPLKDSASGALLKLDYEEESSIYEISVQSGIDGLKKTVKRWIRMLSDLNAFVSGCARTAVTEKENDPHNLSGYEELRGMLDIFTEEELEYAKEIGIF